MYGGNNSSKKMTHKYRGKSLSHYPPNFENATPIVKRKTHAKCSAGWMQLLMVKRILLEQGVFKTQIMLLTVNA